MIKGHCHCKEVSWEYNLDLQSVTACNCTLCRRYGALWAYGYLNEGIALYGQTKTYARGRKINGFHFCTTCGCLAFYLAHAKDEQGRLRMAVNLRMIEDPKNIMHLPVDHFDGLDTFDDQPRDGRTVLELWY